MPELQASWRFELTPELLVKMQQLVEEWVNKYCEEHFEEIVKKCLKEKEKLDEKSILKLRKIPHKKAVTLIKKYIDEHQGCRTSDIIYDLALDPDLVLELLKELEEKEKIRGENIG